MRDVDIRKAAGGIEMSEAVAGWMESVRWSRSSAFLFIPAIFTSRRRRAGHCVQLYYGISFKTHPLPLLTHMSSRKKSNIISSARARAPPCCPH